MVAALMRFVSCDWGTSTFRLRLMGFPEPKEVRTDEGTAKLAALGPAGPERAALFEATLRRGLEQLGAPPDLPLLISGMASSSIGWKELPYARLPFALDGRDVVREELQPHVHLLSGLRSDTDILRGEETEALGLAAMLGDELPVRALFVLPGTHSKHLEIESGRIVNLRTYMTGELFELLARQSVLRHSTDPDAPLMAEAFQEGVETAQRQPLTSALFKVRTRQVLERRDAASNASFLSGLLIGAELASLAAADAPVFVASNERLRSLYATAGQTLKLGARLGTVASDSLAAKGQEVLLRRILPG
jgi:2-dehydro-3-deoxygalactonokinase